MGTTIGGSVRARMEVALGRVFPNAGLLGGVLWVTWVLLVCGGGLESAVPDATVTLGRFYVLSTSAVALVSLAMAMLHEKAYCVLASFPVACAFGILASVGTAAAFYAPVLTLPDSAPAVAGVMTGLGTGYLAMRAACQCALMSPRSSGINAAIAMALALLLAYLVVNLGPSVLCAVTIALPTLAAFASFLPMRERFAAPVDVRGALEVEADAVAPAYLMALPRNVLMIAGSFLLILALFLMDGFLPYAFSFDAFSIQEPSNVLFSLFAMVVVMVVASALPEDFDFARLYYWILLAISLLYAAVAIGHFKLGFTTLFFTTAGVALNVVAWGLLACISHDAGLHAVVVFGLGRAIIDVGSSLGHLMGGYASMVTPEFVTVLGCIALAALVCVGVVPVLGGRVTADGRARGRVSRQVVTNGVASASGVDRGGADQGSADQGSADPEEHECVDELSAAATVVPRPRWKMTVLLAAQDAGLTKRETDVFLLLAKGRDAQTIAEEMKVSLSTVRTHVRGIYSKLGVHSRYEFQQVIAGLEEATRRSG